MKKLIFILFCTLLPMLASANPIEINGIYYNLLKKVKTAEVTYLNQFSGDYYGNIEIPESVEYEGVVYDVTSIGEYAFYFCSNLTSITIPNKVVSIGQCAFFGCSNLTSITIPENVKTIGNSAFIYCSRLTEIVIPNGVTSIGSYAFQYCNGLSSISFPKSLTSTGWGVFSYCLGLRSVNIHSNITSIDGYVFQGCTGLTSINIPNNVTRIEDGAFQGCSGLIKICIGNGVRVIGRSAFAQCSEIKDVYCSVKELSSSENWDQAPLYTDASAFEESYIDYATLHIPESAIDSYKSTSPWSGFGKFETLDGEAIETLKCATPTIKFENGVIIFNCETDDVEYISEIMAYDATKYYDDRVNISYKYKVTVYATKLGYENSDTATAEFTSTGKFGDLTGDGKVDVADHVKLSEIIMNQNKE